MITRADRLELLIAPGDIALAGGGTLVDCVGQTLDAPRCLRLTCGADAVMVLADDGLGDMAAVQSRCDVRLTEGLWPEPLGLNLTVSSSTGNGSWTVESDRYGVRPIYYGFDTHRRPIVSTRPEVVAALIGSRLSAQSLAEQLLLGFTLDDHSPFQDVYRLRPQERLVNASGRGFSIQCFPRRDEGQGEGIRPARPADTWIRAITPTIVEAFDGGAALELSGGVDSRLVLAVGLNAGIKPKLAFTLGGDQDDDVRLARLICGQLGIEHAVIPVEIDPDRLATAGLDFVRRAGFASNACAYAWMPRALDSLASMRSAQIGGGGGECATGFYYTLLDCWCAIPAIQSSWVRQRLFQRGVFAAKVFHPARGRRLVTEVADATLRSLRAGAGTWRRRSDEFYLTQRVTNAGGPVLAASACWYKPLQPLLHEPYIEWGRSLSTSQRANRSRQLKTIHELAPELGGIAFAGRRRTTGKLSLGAVASKLHRRLRNRCADADLGAISAVRALTRDESVVSSLRRLTERDETNLDAGQVERMIATPDRFEHELGTLISAAWAADCAETIASELSTARPVRRAA